MHSTKTVRIKYYDIARQKLRKKLNIIKEKLSEGGIVFETDKVGKICITPPCEAYRCVKTNDLVVKQGNT